MWNIRVPSGLLSPNEFCQILQTAKNSNSPAMLSLVSECGITASWRDGPHEHKQWPLHPRFSPGHLLKYVLRLPKCQRR